MGGFAPPRTCLLVSEPLEVHSLVLHLGPQPTKPTQMLITLAKGARGVAELLLRLHEHLDRARLPRGPHAGKVLSEH